MELIDNKSQYWQGWNDFLGTNADDTHDYILNIIVDINDGFRLKESNKELGEKLIADTSGRYLFYYAYAYRNIDPRSSRWVQVRIYKVNEHFIIMQYGHNTMIWCEYAGTDLMLAIEKFYKYYTDSFLMMLIVHKVDSRLIKKSASKELYPDCYEAGEFKFNLYHEEYLETLKAILSKKLKRKNSNHLN